MCAFVDTQCHLALSPHFASPRHSSWDNTRMSFRVTGARNTQTVLLAPETCILCCWRQKHGHVCMPSSAASYCTGSSRFLSELRPPTSPMCCANNRRISFRARHLLTLGHHLASAHTQTSCELSNSETAGAFTRAHTTSMHSKGCQPTPQPSKTFRWCCDDGRPT